MNRSHAALIAQLSDELEPVRQMRARGGYLLIGLAALVTFLCVWVAAGLWDGVITGEASPFYIIANGLLLLVALASVGATIALATPSVGNRQDGPRWTLAMLCVLPVSALVAATVPGAGMTSIVDPHALSCLASALAAGLLVFACLAIWLRRSAPVSIALAGTSAGIAAGAAGSFRYGLSCPVDTLTHLSIWHVAPALLGGFLGRISLPRIIRW